MNDTPISGPETASSTHHARDASSSRHSFSRSQRNAPLRKRKEDLLERWRLAVLRLLRGLRVRFVDGPFGADAAGAEQDEPIAHARGVGDLMDREKERPAGGGVFAQRRADFARLPQIEAVERLVAEEQRVGREHADRQQRALALPLRQRANPRPEQRRQIQPLDDAGDRGGGSAGESPGVVAPPPPPLPRPPPPPPPPL